MKPLALSKVYRLIEPGPVVLLATAQRGRANVMTMTWHMMVDFTPPRIACIVSDRNFSHAALAATGECVIALPARAMAATVVKIGNVSGRRIDKFARFKLTALPAKCVGAPLIGECFANLECRVTDTRLAADYGLFLLEVVKAWIDPQQPEPKTFHHRGAGVFAADGEVFRLPSNKK